MADLQVKPDPDQGSPFLEDELDESTDLEYYNPNEGSFNSLYLMRLPDYVWKAWAALNDPSLDDNAEIELGKVRQWKERDSQGQVQDRLQMLLRQDVQQHRSLPKEYNMDVREKAVRNTYIFTEQDLPAFAAKNKERAEALARGIPAYLLRQQQQRQTQAQDGGNRVKKSYQRQSVPKKTKIYGTVKHEVDCRPVDNEETRYLMMIRAQQKNSQDEGLRVEIISNVNDRRLHQQADEMEGFIQPKKSVVTKAKKMDYKAARIPQNVLVDKLIECFQRFKYWSVKALRQELQQPDAYLRDTLPQIAIQHSKGSFNNTWSLKPEYRHMLSNMQPVDGLAPAGTETAQDDDEDEDIQMEDVQI